MERGGVDNYHIDQIKQYSNMYDPFTLSTNPSLSFHGDLYSVGLEIILLNGL